MQVQFPGVAGAFFSQIQLSEYSAITRVNMYACKNLKQCQL